MDLLSDLLLQHHILNTRKWLNGILSTLKSKGFTVLSEIDPQMHSPEEVQAIQSLFDGEITIFEKSTPTGAEKNLKTRKLANQK